MTRVPFTQNYRWHLPLLLLVFCCSFFINNGAIFADIMESRNIITAREMVYDHNWLVPTMNGELRLEKPPLPTWIAAITEMISPDNLPLQRAMAGFAAVMLVLFFYKFATKLTDNRAYALVSSLVLCTSYNIILMGRTATWDIYCHAFMIGAIYYLYLALRQNTCKWTYFIGAGIFMGLSFLGKGPVSFYALLLPFVCAYILYYRKETQMKGKWIALAVMILIGIVLSTWWYAYIYIYHQEMASYVFHKESSSWSNHNVRSWYYYWQFFLETGVWSLLTLTTLLVPFWKKRVESSKEYLFCLSWMLLILFFLSLLPEKKTRYLLPILLPAALTMGHLFVYWIRQAKQKMPQLKDRVLYRINAYLIVVAALALPIALYLFMYREGRMGTGMFVWLVVLFLTVAVWLFRSAFKLQPFSFLMGIVALFAVAELFVMPYIGSFVSNSDPKSISATRENPELQPLPFYHSKDEVLRIELVYEAHKKIGDMDLTNKEEIIKALPFVLISQKPAELLIPDSIRKDLNLRFIDCYDNNRWAKGHKRYDSVFISNVTIVEPIKEQ